MLSAATPPASFDDDLPSYLEDVAGPVERVPGLAREVWERAVQLVAPPDTEPAPPMAPPAFAGSRVTSAAFFRMMQVPGPLLARIVDMWWERRAGSGSDGSSVSVAVGRLALSRRGANGRLLSLGGRLECPRRPRPIPVSIELWPHNGIWTRVAMQPEVGVAPSRRYFLTGHAALDQLGAELEEQAASLEAAGPQAPSS